jgi:Holliday junction resolvase
MPNKNYINGRSLEYRVKNLLKENGFAVVRSAGSHGKWDLIAVNESKKTIYLISCKKGKRKRQIKKGSYSVSEFIIGSTKDLTSSLSTSGRGQGCC